MHTRFYNAKKMPLRIHENILVFYKHLPTYNPQKYQLSKEYIQQHSVPIGQKRKNSNFAITLGKFVGMILKEAFKKYEYIDTGERYPTYVIKFSDWNGTLFGKKQYCKTPYTKTFTADLISYKNIQQRGRRCSRQLYGCWYYRHCL